MAILLSSEDQKAVDEVRIELAQVGVDLAEIKVHDLNSRKLKDRMHAALRDIRARMDKLGLMHACARRCANG